MPDIGGKLPGLEPGLEIETTIGGNPIASTEAITRLVEKIKEQFEIDEFTTIFCEDLTKYREEHGLKYESGHMYLIQGTARLLEEVFWPKVNDKGDPIEGESLYPNTLPDDIYGIIATATNADTFGGICMAVDMAGRPKYVNFCSDLYNVHNGGWIPVNEKGVWEIGNGSEMPEVNVKQFEDLINSEKLIPGQIYRIYIDGKDAWKIISPWVTIPPGDYGEMDSNLFVTALGPRTIGGIMYLVADDMSDFYGYTISSGSNYGIPSNWYFTWKEKFGDKIVYVNSRKDFTALFEQGALIDGMIYNVFIGDLGYKYSDCEFTYNSFSGKYGTFPCTLYVPNREGNPEGVLLTTVEITRYGDIRLLPPDSQLSMVEISDKLNNIWTIDSNTVKNRLTDGETTIK